MNASIAIQVLPTVDSKEELIRIVDEAGFLALLQADNEVTASSSENAAQDSE